MESMYSLQHMLKQVVGTIQLAIDMKHVGTICDPHQEIVASHHSGRSHWTRYAQVDG